MRPLLVVLIALLVLVSASPTTNKVLILSTTVTADGSLGGSYEGTAVVNLGLIPDVKSPADWALLTVAEFGSYRAIILGDDTCGPASDYTAAVANRAVWTPMITGNVIIEGTDPVFHLKFTRGDIVAVINAGIAFAVADPLKVGAYLSLGCSYSGVAPNTVVDLLSYFGLFTASGVSCASNSHIVASSPALSGLSDALLSGWSCSVHNTFLSLPSTFVILAIATDPSLTGPGSTTFADGSVGLPYFLARGVVPVLCGDGIVQTGEDCDDGALNGILGDPCSSACKLHWCGDGIVDTGEACDLGALDGAPSSPCGSDCTIVALPPVVRCKSVSTHVDASCLATADINDGSFDLNSGGVLNCFQTPEGPYGLGTVAVNLTCTDNYGLSGSCSASVTVIDTIHPAILCPADERVQCTSYAGTPITAPSASATDNCGGKVTISCVSAPEDAKCSKEGFVAPSTPFTTGSPLGLGKHEITCTATDLSGNSANCSYTVKVVDTTPPKLSCPAPSAVECTNKRGVVTFAPTATDACSPPGSIDIRCTPASGSSFPLGSTRVKCTAKDGAGNCGSCSFPVVVRDTLPPTFSRMGMARRYEKCDKRFERIRAKECSGTIRDQCWGLLDAADSETVSFCGSRCNEHEIGTGPGLGITSGDVKFVIPKGKRGAGELSFCIDRDPKGSGRVCHFDVTVSDPSGNSATIVDACSAVVTDKITDKFPPDGLPKLCRKCAGGKVSECAHS